MEATSMAADAGWQRARYEGGFYTRLRRLRWLFRYDCRYRLALTEEIFARHGIPFERQRVFELGFGTGYLLLRFDTSCTLHGCEASGEAIEALEADPGIASYAEARFVRCHGDGAPAFPEDGYDVIIASHVLEHVPDDLAALRAMAQRARPGGAGLFFMPLERPRHNPDHARIYTAAGFEERLRDAGWEPVEISENFRYASHFVQVLNWPSRARIPVVGTMVEAVKNAVLSIPPTGFVQVVDKPLEALHVAPRQLTVLARAPSA